MSAIAEAPTVPEARRQLANTRGMSSAETDALQKVVDRFHASRPINKVCVACGGMQWAEHQTAAGSASWACSSCHRPSSLTAEEWHNLRDAKAAQDAERQACIAADTPAPRHALKAAVERRAEAAEVLAKLESAIPGAREGVTVAMARHSAAQAAMQDAEAAAIQRLAASLTGGKLEPSAAATDAARGRLRLAEDALAAARGARALVEDKLHYAQASLTNATAAARTAAIAVLAAETLEPLIEQAIEARASYLESIAGLGWLLRNHALPNGDARAHQLVRDADTPPSRWPEAHADGGMTARLAQLMEGSAP